MKTFIEWMGSRADIYLPERLELLSRMGFRDPVIVPFSRLGEGYVYHKGEIESLQHIDPFRPSIKQAKKGRSYAGFYVGDMKHAQSYPGDLFEFSIRPNALVLMAGMIDRVSLDELRRYKEAGIDMLWGWDIRGWKQGVIINKEIITNMNKKETT